jgi:adenylate cyclase class 2
MEEIEVKFLNIDKPLFEEKLVSLGATKSGEYHYRRKIYDFPDGRLDKDSAWVRLRDEESQITLSYKKRFNNTDELRGGGTEEIEVTVSDFATAEKLLAAMGLVEVMYKENKRTRYMLDGVEVDIDTWPLIPPYVEIEGKSWEAVQAVAQKLGFDWTERLVGSNRAIYNHYGIKEDAYKILTFERQE